MNDTYRGIYDRMPATKPILKPGKKPKPEKPGMSARKSKTLTPAQRKKIYQKYDGRCSYCGHGIEFHEMQVDHKIAKARMHHNEYRSADWWDNLMPSCRRCNHYKRAETVEQYRRKLMTIQDRIKTDYIVKVAIDYGVIEFTPFDGEFYFEKFKKGNR